MMSQKADCDENTNLKIKLDDYIAWFKYAENIGEQRLYNYLMSSSILLLACATIAAGDNTKLRFLMILLSLCGLVLSYACFIHGKRQIKFHKVFYDKIKFLINSNKIFEDTGIAILIAMNDNSSAIPLQYQLDKEEHKYCSYCFLVFVPILIGIIFLGVTIWSIFYFK